MKKYLICSAVLLLSILLAGCTGTNGSYTEAPSPSNGTESPVARPVDDTEIVETPSAVYADTKEILYESEDAQYTDTFNLFNSPSFPFITYIPETWSVEQRDDGATIKHEGFGYMEISFLEKETGQQEATEIFNDRIGGASNQESREENMPEWAVASLYLYGEDNSMTWAVLGMHDQQYFYIVTSYTKHIEGDFPLLQAIFSEWRWKDTDEALNYSLN